MNKLRIAKNTKSFCKQVKCFEPFNRSGALTFPLLRIGAKAALADYAIVAANIIPGVFIGGPDIPVSKSFELNGIVLSDRDGNKMRIPVFRCKCTKDNEIFFLAWRPAGFICN